MRIVTFMGNATYLDEVVRKNKITDLYIDKSYTYKLGGKWEEIPDSLLPKDTIFLNSSDIEHLSKKLTSYSVRVVTLDNNIKYDLQQEVINRRLRIAKMISVILNDIYDDILFVDSDVILNEKVFDSISYDVESTTSHTPISICIPALMKPSTTTVFTFCYSTNFYLPLLLHDKLYDAMKMYVDRQIYAMYPVDLYIHRVVLNTWKTMLINGVCHYIRGNVYCI